MSKVQVINPSNGAVVVMDTNRPEDVAQLDVWAKYGKQISNKRRADAAIAAKHKSRRRGKGSW